MTISHAGATIVASGTNAASATTTSSTIDNSAGLGSIITTQVTNGATGPTVGCTATLNVSLDGTTFRYWTSQTAGLTNNGVYQMPFRLPVEAIKGNVVFAGNTGQGVTVVAEEHKLVSAA